MEMTIQEVKQLDKDSYQIIDIRDDNEIAHGAIPGAVALKVEEIAENPLVDKSKKLVICCSRGKYSQEVVPELIEKGLDAVSLKGGYIAWLMDRSDAGRSGKRHQCRCRKKHPEKVPQIHLVQIYKSHQSV